MKRMQPEQRKERLMQVMMVLSRRHGYQNIRRSDIADKAKVSEGLVSAYWGTMTQIKRAIMRRAIDDKDIKIVAQGLAAGDSLAKRAPQELRQKAADSLAQ